MAKIHVSTILNSSENGITSYTGSGIFDHKKIIFYEDKVKVTIKFDKESLELERSNDQYTIFLPFKNTLTNAGMYDIKCDSIQIPIEVTTHVLDIEDGFIHIDYDLLLGGVDQGRFVYDIKYEVTI